MLGTSVVWARTLKPEVLNLPGLQGNAGARVVWHCYLTAKAHAQRKEIFKISTAQGQEASKLYQQQDGQGRVEISQGFQREETATPEFETHPSSSSPGAFAGLREWWGWKECVPLSIFLPSEFLQFSAELDPVSFTVL